MSGYIKSGKGYSSWSYNASFLVKRRTRHPSFPSHSSFAVLRNLFILLANGRCIYSISLQATLTKGLSFSRKLFSLQVLVISKEGRTLCL